MRILVTAIGSMSADSVISNLKREGYYVVGCDIYPGEWHAETQQCDAFYRAPHTTDEIEYSQFLMRICLEEELTLIIPLTDLEVDVLDRQRELFADNNVTLCIPSAEVVAIARNKFILYKHFKNNPLVPTIKTCLLSKLDPTMTYPCIAKPSNGRSSEGLLRSATKSQILAIEHPERYIIQEEMPGNIFTVDYCRSERTGTSCAIPREELIRTKNGAGLTVQISNAPDLISLTSYIGDKLNINGCVNMEFIYHNKKYYLIDINPRFSAGVAFSVLTGYNMVSNHLRCFTSGDIDPQLKGIEERILIKQYKEIAMDSPAFITPIPTHS